MVHVIYNRRSSFYTLLKNKLMKNFLIFLFLFTAIAVGKALGQESVSLAWGQDTDPTVVGYELYYTTSSRLLVAGSAAPIGGATSGSVGNVTSFIVTALSGGVTYYFSVTAYNGSGIQSVLSNVVSVTTPTSTPTPTPAPTPTPHQRHRRV